MLKDLRPGLNPPVRIDPHEVLVEELVHPRRVRAGKRLHQRMVALKDCSSIIVSLDFLAREPRRSTRASKRAGKDQENGSIHN
jgi:hypothetical protein